MDNVNISKIDLEDGNSYYLIEKANIVSGEIKDISNSSFKIKNVNRSVGMCSIVLMEEDNFIGHISVSLFDDNTASLTMCHLHSLLPKELKGYEETIKNHDVAIFVDEKYRGLGKSRELIYLMFCYLRAIGITDVKVSGITNDIAWKTYLGTGATPIDDRTAIYYDINKILDSDIFARLCDGSSRK